MAYRDKRKKDGNRIISVYKRNDDRWCIEMLLNGKRKYEYRSTEYNAEKRANYWREKFGEPLKSLPKPVKTTPSGVAKYWENQLRRASELMLASPDQKEYLAVANMMAKLATAAVKTVGHISGADGDEDEDLSGTDPTLDVAKMSTEELEALENGGLESGDGRVLHEAVSEDEEGGGGARPEDFREGLGSIV